MNSFPCRSHKESLFEKVMIPLARLCGFVNLTALTVLGEIADGALGLQWVLVVVCGVHWINR